MSIGRREWIGAVLGLPLATAAVNSPGALLWRDPGKPEEIDFAGTFDPDVHLPQPPFRFESEDLSGTQPKLFVRDANGAKWNVKFGSEVKSEAFCWRIVRACGFFAEQNFFVPNGVFEGLPRKLRRSSTSIQSDGMFKNGRFQLRSPRIRFIPNRSWHWTDNPFHNTPELNGLKLLLMLLSNFDNKDSRVGDAGGPNTGRFLLVTREGKVSIVFAFTDWGSTMGKWGHLSGQSDWDCAGFTAQTPELVKGVHDGHVVFGFEGHVPGFNDGIAPTDVRWLTDRLGRITDAQIRAGLVASGATIAEVDCFGKALRDRVAALLAIPTTASKPSEKSG